MRDRRQPVRTRRKGSGFTLIELLVVIAIIAILAAILFPMFTAARERAKSASCHSNMKQIATAIQMYVDEWNGAYFDQSSVGLAYQNYYSNQLGTLWIQLFSHRSKSDNGGPGGMAASLGKYIRSPGVFKCLSEWKQRPANAPTWLPYEVSSSYYYKHALCYYANYKKRPVRQSEVSFATRVALLYEEAWHMAKTTPFLWGNYEGVPSKRVNCIFVDCHVGRIDVPYNKNSGYDGNWFFYGHGWDVSAGGRDRL